ncbi:MAG: OmpA family protein [bacterium]|nr:OmpA family protein [bacterium]
MLIHQRLKALAIAFLVFSFTFFTADLFALSDLEKCENDLSGVKLKFKYCHKAKVALEKELAELKEEYKNEKARLENIIAGLENDIKGLKNDIKGLEAKIKGLEADVARLTKEKADQKTASDKKYADLQKANSAKEKTHQTALKNLQKQLADSSKAQQAKEKEKAELQKKHAEDVKKYSVVADELKQIKQAAAQKKADEEAVETKLVEQIKDEEIQLQKSGGKLVINLEKKISFYSGSARLKRETFEILEKVAKILETSPDTLLIIEGHTDSDRIVGGWHNNNWHLSTRRALAVLDFILRKNKNLDEARFTIVGHGEKNPVAPNDTPENKALNRRVDIIVVPMTKEEMAARDKKIEDERLRLEKIRLEKEAKIAAKKKAREEKIAARKKAREERIAKRKARIEARKAKRKARLEARKKAREARKAKK